MLDYRELFERGPGLLLVVDPQLRVEAVTDAYLEVAGATRDALLGHDAAESLHDPALKSALEGALRAPAATKGTLSRRGGRCWRSLDTPLRDGAGRVAHVVHSLEDVTQVVGLQASESRLQALFENSRDAILLAEPRGPILEANAAARRLFGREDLRGAPLASVFGRSDPRLEAAQDARRAHAFFSGPLSFVRGDGGGFEGEATISDYPGGDGRPVVSVIVRDVSERRRADEARANLAGIVTASVDAIYSVAPGTLAVTAWNAGAERLFGYRADEIIGRSACLFVPDERRDEALDALAQAAGGAAIGPYETVRRRKDGSLVDVSMTVFTVKDAEGRVLSHAAIARDISALKEREARFRALLEAAPDATVVVDASGAIVQLNAEAERMFGYARAELLGRPVEMLVPRPRRQAHAACREAFMAAPRAREMGAGMALFGLRRDGTEFPVDVGLSPLETPEGLLTIAAVRDITERQRWMEEVAMRTAELRKAQELHSLKDHFLSTLSHEMKTPLAMIAGYAELLEDQHPGDPLAAGVMDGSRRLTEHINRMLDYSALLSRTMPLYPQAVDMAELVGNAVAIAGDAFREKGVALETDVAPDAPPIEVDPRRVVQILTELLDNARRFTPPGGRAGVRIRPADGGVRIEVWDTGEGVPAAWCASMWEPFSQAEIRDAHRAGGLGLGLTLVRELARLHGGRAWSEPVPAGGTRFLVELPGRRPVAAEGRPADHEVGKASP